MRDRFTGVLLIILGLALIAFGVYTLMEPLFATGFPLFLAGIAAGCCALAMGFTMIRARILAKIFIFLTAVTAAVFFIWAAITVVF